MENSSDPSALLLQTPHSAKSEGPAAPTSKSMTYPPAAHIPVPIDIKHALSGKYAAAWRKAIRLELASLYSKGVFRMENLPLGRNAIGTKWVFKVNAKPGGSVDRFKASRLLPNDSVNERESTIQRHSLPLLSSSLCARSSPSLPNETCTSTPRISRRRF
jgi:hypothetical protein